jgi:hypothetical protein
MKCSSCVRAYPTDSIFLGKNPIKTHVLRQPNRPVYQFLNQVTCMLVALAFLYILCFLKCNDLKLFSHIHTIPSYKVLPPKPSLEKCQTVVLSKRDWWYSLFIINL